MLEAGSVAIVGASPSPGSFGYKLVTEVRRSSAAVEIHAVNPRHSDVLGSPCLPSLDDIAGPVDLVLLGVPDRALDEELRRAATRGDRSAVIFGSAAGVPGLQGRLAGTARNAGMALCGAGCMGFVNLEHGLMAVGYVEPDPLPRGPVAFVTHSGSAFSALLRTHRRIGFTIAVSSGQELVTTTASYVDYALDLPRTKVVALLLETLRDLDALRHALARAAEQDVPVVALAVGTSPAGREMVAAHSQALAGADGAWEALFDAYDVVRVHDLDEMADTLELFGSGRRARVATADGWGVGAVHDSGAERALVVDMAHQLKVPLATINAATTARLAVVLEPGLEPTNPVDVWGTGSSTRERFTESLMALAADDAVVAVALAVDLVPEPDGDDSYPRAVVDVHRATAKPVVVLSNAHNSLDQAAAAAIRAQGVPVLEGTCSGLLALRHLLDHAEARARRVAAARSADPVDPVDPQRRGRWLARLAESPPAGPQALELLADYGLHTTPALAASTLAGTIAAAHCVGWPVALKTARPDIAHKSDVGGVVLGVSGAAAMAEAYGKMAALLGPQVSVATMAPDGVELALGITRDPQLGPLVIIGAGGLLVEVLGDRAVALPPVTSAEALRLLERLDIRPLLDGVRGAPAADLSAIATAIVAISQLAVELGEALEAVDVNPLVCGPHGAIAVDALVVRRQKIT
jgi:acetate---CoA ligase (ADP-forming)